MNLHQDFKIMKQVLLKKWWLFYEIQERGQRKICIQRKIILFSSFFLFLFFSFFSSFFFFSFLFLFFSFLFFSLERFDKFFAFIILQPVVSPRSYIHLHIIISANHMIVFQKRMLIEWLNGYIIFLCVYIFFFSTIIVFY